MSLHVDIVRDTSKAAFHDFRINNLEDKLIFGRIFNFLGFRFRSKSAWKSENIWLTKSGTISLLARTVGKTSPKHRNHVRMKGDRYYISKSCDASDFLVEMEIRLLQESASKEMLNLRSDSDFRLKICLDKIIFEILLVTYVYRYFFRIKIFNPNVRKSSLRQILIITFNI